jgi:hypothetical protein
VSGKSWTTAGSRGFGLPRKTGRNAAILGVGIGIVIQFHAQIARSGFSNSIANPKTPGSWIFPHQRIARPEAAGLTELFVLLPFYGNANKMISVEGLWLKTSSGVLPSNIWTE